MTPVTTTTNTATTKTKSVFAKAPFRVLATLLVIEGVMIGQVLSRPGEAKEPTAKTEATATLAQDTKDENCKEIVNLFSRRECWLRKVNAGEKNLYEANLSGANLRGAILDSIKKDENTKGL